MWIKVKIKNYITPIIFIGVFVFNGIFAAGQQFIANGGLIHDYNGEFYRDIFAINVEGLPHKLDTSFGLKSVCLNINHAKVSDLKIQLMSPDGTTIWLTNRNGGDNGEDYQNTCFSNNGFNGYIHQGSAPFIGEYIPDGRIEFINNQQNPNGYWYLIIEDLHSDNVGKLNSIKLQFGNNPVFDAKSQCSINNATKCKCTNNSSDSILLPDLVIVPAFTNHQIQEYKFNDPVYPGQLRIAASIANIGEGPLEIQGSSKWYCNNLQTDSGTRCSNKELARQHILQNIYFKQQDKLAKKSVDAGAMYFDEKPGHQHYHVDNWIELRVVKKIRIKKRLWQKIIGRSNKVSYCLFDTGICQDADSLCYINNVLWGKSKLANYGLGNFINCQSKTQGISVGGYDTYGMLYEGQSVQLPKGLPQGWYYVQIIIDPLHLYKESNIFNNVYEKKIYLKMQ
jgi:subtilisin-like proprotein convertase family protein